MIDKEKFNTENFKAQFQKKAEYTGTGEGTGSYEYIAKLLLHPVKDGRHRLLWLVLAPYAVTTLGRPREDAIDFLAKYLKACDELNPCKDVIDMIEQYIDYAAQMGLHPPRLETLKQNDPDLYEIVSEAIKE